MLKSTGIKGIASGHTLNNSHNSYNMKLLLLLFVVLLVKYTKAVCDNTIYESGVSKQKQDVAVKAHNHFRLMIAQGKLETQPRGINLKRMKWDDKLAKAAQDIANTCDFEHVSVQDDRWPLVGQNLYTSWSTRRFNGPHWNSAVREWFKEHELYTYGPNYQPAAGHYTQVVWANSDHVGCGFIHFENDGSRKIYVCNYGPGGNYIGQVPYETGTSGCENLC